MTQPERVSDQPTDAGDRCCPKRVGDPGWFKVTEIIGGHTWGHVMVSMIEGECCRTCGLMRRRDRMNKPCRGRVKIELR